MDCPTSNLFKDGFVEEAIEEFMKNTHNSLNSTNFCFPMINYTGPIVKVDEAVELLTIYNLSTLKSLAVSYVKSLYNNSLLCFDANNNYYGYVFVESLDDHLSTIRDSIRKIVIDNKIVSEEEAFFSFLDKKMNLIAKSSENQERIDNISLDYDEKPDSTNYNCIRIEIKDEILLKDIQFLIDAVSNSVYESGEFNIQTYGLIVDAINNPLLSLKAKGLLALFLNFISGAFNPAGLSSISYYNHQPSAAAPAA